MHASAQRMANQRKEASGLFLFLSPIVQWRYSLLALDAVTVRAIVSLGKSRR